MSWKTPTLWKGFIYPPRGVEGLNLLHVGLPMELVRRLEKPSTISCTLLLYYVFRFAYETGCGQLLSTKQDARIW
jgi:hypothetical protein